jgi:hypothetical protein
MFWVLQVRQIWARQLHDARLLLYLLRGSLTPEDVMQWGHLIYG